MIVGMLDSKVLWVVLPLFCYGVFVLAPPVRRRLSRHSLNVHVSLLLLAYLAVTAGLGVFWVANQQLPVFDWHYLFGYATVLLVAAHLSFNLRIVLRSFQKKRGRKARPREAKPKLVPARRRALSLALTAMGVLASFGLGMRHGASELRITTGADGAGADAPKLAEGDLVKIVEQYHDFASASRSGVFARAAGVEWGPKPAAFKGYPRLPSRSLRTLQAADLAGRSLSVALGEPAAPQAALGWQTLGAMLFHTVGITAHRSGWALRAAPSSGALFPTELYLRVDGVDGVAPGLYHYDPQEELLQRLPAQRSQTLGLASAESFQGVPVSVVFTSMFRRTGHKYRDRAYRYAVADAGHALENLRVAASEAGLVATHVTRFDESIASAELGLDAKEEGVLAVVLLSSTQPRARLASNRFESALASVPEDRSLGVTGWVQRATSLRLKPRDVPKRSIELPAPTLAKRTALDTIRARRSQRRFTSERLELAELSSLLSDLRSEAPLLSVAVRAYVVVNRVRGLQAGVYRYRPGTHALSKIRQGDFAGRAESVAFEQEVIGRAAAVFVFSVDRDSMFEQGARGYRQALLETGLFGERLLLSAVARGLGACPVGAFYDDEAAELLGVDPAREWVLHFAAVGRI